ncbi:MAG TPA: ATP-binding protein [Nitrospira sp.]|mgnify:CR=1 FL=1|nr:ATP-binding protein [Nitrospira sp.]
MMNHSENRRLLVVDDNVLIHEDFRKILQPRHETQRLDEVRAAIFGSTPRPKPLMRFELDCAEQGQTALALVQTACREGRPYAVAFVDMRMPPGWDGLETIEHVWAVDPEIQMVICTAYTDHSWEDIIHRLGYDDRLLIVQKPFSSVEVSQLATALTTKWNLARQARQRLETAEAVNVAKSEFLVNVSHEIRTPMNGLIGMAELLLQTPLSEKQRGYVGTLQKSGLALVHLIDDVLDLSKIGAGRLELEMSPFDLCQLVQGVRELYTAQVESKGLKLTVALPDRHLPAYEGDPDRIRQILHNLLGNALKFTKKGEIALHVAVAEETKETVMLRLTVRDTGIGMDAVVLDKLFIPFTQGDGSSTRKHGGLGLGLAIVKQLACKMGGDVGVDSVPGTGSTFWCTLRLRKLVAQPLHAQAS